MKKYFIYEKIADLQNKNTQIDKAYLKKKKFYFNILKQDKKNLTKLMIFFLNIAYQVHDVH